jgi:hypothetical protein
MLVITISRQNGTRQTLPDEATQRAERGNVTEWLLYNTKSGAEGLIGHPGRRIRPRTVRIAAGKINAVTMLARIAYFNVFLVKRMPWVVDRDSALIVGSML